MLLVFVYKVLKESDIKNNEFFYSRSNYETEKSCRKWGKFNCYYPKLAESKHSLGIIIN